MIKRPRRGTKLILSHANKKAYSCSLVNIFIRLLDRMIYWKLATSKVLVFYLVSCSHTEKSNQFSCDAAHCFFCD